MRPQQPSLTSQIDGVRCRTGRGGRPHAKLAKEKSKDQKCFLCASAPLREVPAIRCRDADARCSRVVTRSDAGKNSTNEVPAAEVKVSRKGAKLAEDKLQDQKCFLCASAPLREIPAIRCKDADARCSRVVTRSDAGRNSTNKVPAAEVKGSRKGAKLAEERSKAQKCFLCAFA